jgi:hypothetical protein
MAFGNGEHAVSDPPDRYFIKNVPLTRQLPNYCGPASLSSLLAYWGISDSQESIGEKTYDNKCAGTNGADLLMHCRDRGLAAYSFNGTLDQLKRMIWMGYPVIVLQNASKTWKEGHFRIAVGYNDETKTITLRDGTQSDYVVLPYTDFDYIWEKRGRWALIVTPRKKDIFGDSLGKGNTVVHMDLAQAYLHRGDYARAKQECLDAQNLEPDNPYVKDLLARAEAGARKRS